MESESEFRSRSLKILPGVEVGVGAEFFSTTPTPDYLACLTFVTFVVSKKLVFVTYDNFAQMGQYIYKLHRRDKKLIYDNFAQMRR